MGEIDDIMTLLAIGIVADGRVANEELYVFKKTVTQITLSNSDIKLPSEDETITWFKTYYTDIQSIVFGPRAAYEARLNTLLDRLSGHIRPGALLHALDMISIADGEMHPAESQLTAYIKRRWKIA